MSGSGEAGLGSRPQTFAGTSLFDVLKIQDELELILGVEVDLIPDSGLKDGVRVRIQRDMIAL